MAAKLIRDDMLESERVHNVSVEAKWLYVTILLLADDVGLFEVNQFKLGRKAGLDQKGIAPLLDELTGQDLIRPYKAESKAFAFVPRYRQRLRVKRTKCPMPPLEMMADDLDAINKIKDLDLEVRTDVSGVRTNVRNSPPEPEPEPEEEKKRHMSSAKLTTPPCPHSEIVSLYHEKLPTLPRVRLTSKAREKATSAFWAFVMTSRREDNIRRAETPVAALEWIGQYFERANANDFLMSRNRPQGGAHSTWRCDFDFLLTERGRKHVIEKTEAE